MKQLIDIGDPNAPQGSEPWCRSFHQSLCRLKREGEFAVSNLKYSLRQFRDHDYFKQLIDDKGQCFQSWEQFIECREPYGLGMNRDVAAAIISEPDDKRLLKDVLGKHGRPKKGKEKGDRITFTRGTTGRAYILARLLRADPADLALKGMTAQQFADLADQVRAKRISAKAAAITAGWGRKRVHRCPVCGHEW